MKRATEIRPTPKRLAFLALTLTVLSGCEDPFGVATEQAAKPDGDPSSTTELLPQAEGKQRDVEAPDVFNVTEAGLWDGRPSLGGIWVAHPDVNQPERVMIENTANKKTVTGALFRRERDLPGPALQVSSAAAEKLGMLAGAPTKIHVVALRRETIEEKPVAEEPAQTATGAEAPPEPTAESGSAIANDSDTAEAEKPKKRKWWQKKEPAAAAAGAAAVAASDAEPEADDVVSGTQKPAGDAAPSPQLSDAPVAAPAEKPAKRKWWQKKKPDEITETPLDPIEGAAAAIDAAEPTPVAAAAVAGGTAAAASSLAKPYVQIGTFSVEANANTAAEKIRRNGMSADVRSLQTGDKTIWRVLVGPAATRAERKAIQNDARDLGFADSFVVKN